MVTKKPEDIISHFFKTMCKMLFLVGAGLVFAITLSAFINDNLANRLKENISVPLLIIYAELIGFASPGPRYIIYPILVKLVEFGVSTSVIIALIGGHVLIEPSTTLIEAGFFGYRFPIKRFVVSFILIFFAGIVTAILENHFRLDIL